MSVSDWAWWAVEVIGVGVGLTIIAIALAAIRYHWERRQILAGKWIGPRNYR